MWYEVEVDNITFGIEAEINEATKDEYVNDSWIRGEGVTVDIEDIFIGKYEVSNILKSSVLEEIKEKLINQNQ